MALVVSALKNDLLSAFNSMNGDDKVFSEKVSAAVKKYAESGSIATTDIGTVSAGAFTGAGTGQINCDASICETIIYSACQAMKNMTTGGNKYLAEKLASGIHSMIAAGQVKTNVTGMVTPPSSSPVPLSGTATGTLAGVPASMQAAFLAAFNAVDGMNKGGDDYMAQQMAAAVDAYLKSGVASTSGGGPLTGSAGTGNMA
jgi:hypothetical protein